MFVRLCNRDDLPELWSPTTTSYEATMRFKKGTLRGIGRLLGEEEHIGQCSSHEVRQSSVTRLGSPDGQHHD
jgi:hypothetical protein